jgi:hypothetical protein
LRQIWCAGYRARRWHWTLRWCQSIDGGVIIALYRLNEIRLIDSLERLAVVQAGARSSDRPSRGFVGLRR